MTTTTTTAPRRGRPPLEWLTHAQVAAVRPGVALCIELHGRHQARIYGRVATITNAAMDLHGRGEDLVVDLHRIKRARLVDSLYEPGDPVRKRGVSADEWRGGVVRSSGADVLVEQHTGEFIWLRETTLEPA